MQGSTEIVINSYFMTHTDIVKDLHLIERLVVLFEYAVVQYRTFLLNFI